VMPFPVEMLRFFERAADAMNSGTLKANQAGSELDRTAE